MVETPTTTPCPGCEVELPDDDFQAQRDHMTRHHPDIIAERQATFNLRYEDGKWVKVLVRDD